MGTRKYPSVSKYPWITRIEIPARVWGRARGTIYIQRSRNGYHTTRTHGYPLTSLLQTLFFFIPFG